VPAEPVPREAPLPTVRDGVFFTLPEALPRGRHNLTREQVTDAQRERLLAAVTELLAGRGYAGFGVGDVAGRAGVSLGTFYACFGGKDACIFAGYDRFIEVLLRNVAAVDLPNEDRAALTDALVGAYLETLGQDLVVARAYQVEIDALDTAAEPDFKALRADLASWMSDLFRLPGPPGAERTP
jgi:AcrR family transcriptional regulator